MTTNHLAKAREYIGRGEEFYGLAADEIIAAMADDALLTFAGVDRDLGKYGGYASALVTWRTKPGNIQPTPFAGQYAKVKAILTKSTLKNQEQIDALIADPEIRDNVGRALDRHYQAETKARAKRQMAHEVETHGGEDEHAAFQRRQRIAEVVNVARGLTTGMRFVVEEVRRLDLDEFEEAGVRDELVNCASEVEGFAVLMRQFLSGQEITDADIAEFIGETS